MKKTLFANLNLVLAGALVFSASTGEAGCIGSSANVTIATGQVLAL